MSDAGPRKIEVIRIVRQVTGLGLKESKDLIEARPPVTLASGLREEAARRMAEDLERVGAKAATVV
jgi:large subunit ribosomal protein L7/L12